MEGLMFYWIYWFFWVYLTFIVKRNHPYRLLLSALILIVIILSNVTFRLGSVEIYASGLLLLVFSIAYFSMEKRGTLIYFMISSFIVMLAYVAFNLFEIFDPIWMIFQKEWMMAICFGYLAILLQKTLQGRLLIIVCGTMQGEILFAYFLNKFHFSYPIGSLAYLDVCSLISLLLVSWSFLENAGTIFQNYSIFFEKGKQRSS